jgi:hypothetical protein
MRIQMSAAAVRARAKSAGFDKAISIRTGDSAARAGDGWCDGLFDCSVRIAVLKPGLEEWLKELFEEAVAEETLCKSR